MIDEHTSEQAALFTLNLLDPEEAHTFFRRMEGDAALRTHVDELTATAAALAHAAPAQPLPPSLEARVLEAIRHAELPAIVPFPSRRPPLAWAGWAAAACLALACLWLAHDRSLLRGEVAEWRERDTLAQVRIATLSSQLQQAPDASAVVVWDAQRQRGILKAARMPAPGENRDYQLWVIDPQYAHPVSAGVFKVDQPEITRVAFEPGKPIGKAEKFAVSLEQKGGVEEVHGPIVLIGQ